MEDFAIGGVISAETMLAYLPHNRQWVLCNRCANLYETYQIGDNWIECYKCKTLTDDEAKNKKNEYDKMIEIIKNIDFSKIEFNVL